MKERCNLWWCWRKSAGYVIIRLEVEDQRMIQQIPYCKKHGEIAKELIENNEINLTP